MPGFYLFSVFRLMVNFFGTRPVNFSVLAHILPEPILAGILPFFGIHTDSTLFRSSSRKFFDTCTESTFCRYSRILKFFGTHTNLTLFRYSSGQFFDTRTDSTYSWYSLGFYLFSVLTPSQPFFGIPWDKFSILARILPVLGTRPDSTFFRY